jgi:hypothetical protein
MNVNVLDIFYKNIVPEATTGRIDCNLYYNMAFSTKIVEENKEYTVNIDNNNLLIPTLVIKNKDLFDSLLIEYVSIAMKFYDSVDYDIADYKMYDENKRICQEKVILALLFANATVEDFNNPCNYLRKRIYFFNNDISGTYNLGVSDMLNGDVLIDIDKDIINNETPYQMIIKVMSKDGEVFEFPRIKLGVSDDTVYIYAIQNKLNNNNSFCKKINRILYKVGEGYSQEYDVDSENLKDVTSSFLVALNMCISFLDKFGYSKIAVPSCLIERWNAKSIANSLKAKYKKLDGDSEKILFDEQDELQRNLTNKLIRTFLRLGCHYNNIDVVSFPYEVDSSLHLFINNDDLRCNNNLLYETYMLVQNRMHSKRK